MSVNNKIKLIKDVAMGKKFKCYFAHLTNMIGSEEEADIIEELEFRRIDIINPFDRQKEIRDKYMKIGWNKATYDDYRTIWSSDLSSIAESDMILAWLSNASTGCGAEIQYAYMLHKFIHIIAPKKHPLYAHVLTGGNRMFLSIEDWKNNKWFVWD